MAQPPTARSIVLDLLATGPQSRYSSAELAQAGAAFGIGAVGMRTAVARLTSEGRIRRIGRGVYGPGPASEPLQRRLRDWHGVLARRLPWTGAWLLAIPGPPERADRNLWRRTLRAFDFNGFAEAEPGLWVRPDNLAGGAAGARAALADFGYAETLLLVSASGVDAARERRFRELWHADAVRADLVAATRALEAHWDRIGSQRPDRAAADTLTFGRAAIRAILHDPLLPDELCPDVDLRRLVETMEGYDLLGRQAWERYFGRKE